MKKNIGRRKCTGLFLVIFFLYFIYSPFVLGVLSIPEKITIFEGDEKGFELAAPFGINLQDNEQKVLQIDDVTLKQAITERNRKLGVKTLLVQPKKTGRTELILSLFGMVPVKKIDVIIGNKKEFIPGGECVGVKIYTDGVLVVGISRIYDGSNNISPGVEAGIKAGDILIDADGTKINDTKHLTEIINKNGEKVLPLKLNRKGNIIDVNIKPVFDELDEVFRLGLWIRDSTIGVGTLTFIDPSDGDFGALGHPVTDMDTGVLLPVGSGEVTYTSVIDVIEGKEGKPGELKGLFSSGNQVVGNINNNTKYGIYGTMIKKSSDDYKRQPIPLGKRENVKEGPAKILTTVDKEGVKEYDIEIIKVNRQDKPGVKGIVLQVTDKELIDITGGIVQGMSGSPIIQDGKLIGAVTHVFVNNPRRGYGIFIDWMLENVE